VSTARLSRLAAFVRVGPPLSASASRAALPSRSRRPSNIVESVPGSGLVKHEWMAGTGGPSLEISPGVGT
jgi:hypothetical protein